MRHRRMGSIIVKASPRAAPTHDSQTPERQAWPSALSLVRRFISRTAVPVSAASALAVAATLASAETLTDSADRTVTVAHEIASVVPAGPPAQVLLQVLAADKLTGLVEPFTPQHVIYVDPTLAKRPQIPMLNRTAAPGDVAAVAALKPGLVVDYGSLSARYVAADEKIGKELSVPSVIFDGDLTEAASVARALATALGVPARGEAVAASIEHVLAAAKPASDVADADRVAVYLARGEDGLLAVRAGTSFDEPIRLAGGRNVVGGTGGTFKRMSVEDVVALKPSVVVFAEQEALSSPLHAGLPKGTRFVLDAGEPYKVLTGPPSLNRLVGLAALAPILHPDKVKADPDAVLHLATLLFPRPAGVAYPAPLQVRE